MVAEETKGLPPRTHNLIALAQRAKLTLPADHRDFIGKMNDASVVTRYPGDLLDAVSQYPEPVAGEYLERTKELIAWIRQDPRLQRS